MESYLHKSRKLLENELLTAGMVMMRFLDLFDISHENHIANWQVLGVTAISLELLTHELL
jgi:hypothetical protein